MIKKRADILLVEKGYINSREKAKTVILEGQVNIGDKKVQKPSDKFLESLEIKIINNPLVYVSRAGMKLKKTIDKFNIDLKEKIVIDIGSSTGGFTQCMLEEGAKSVYAIDVGKDQLVDELRYDKRVVVMEETNIRGVEKSDIHDDIDFISIDVSFISLKLVLPIAYDLLKQSGELIALIKPQFEVGRDNISKKGIVKDEKLHLSVLKDIIEFSSRLGFEFNGLTFSPVMGTKGNIEFLVYIKKCASQRIVSDSVIHNVLEEAYKILD